MKQTTELLLDSLRNLLIRGTASTQEEIKEETTIEPVAEIKTDEYVVYTKKSYESVPVLRNLVPSQVLLGNSSFNTGNSISSGLPNYSRNRIKAIAGILDRG